MAGETAYLTAVDGIFGTLDGAVGRIVGHGGFQSGNTQFRRVRYFRELRRRVSHADNSSSRTGGNSEFNKALNYVL